MVIYSFLKSLAQYEPYFLILSWEMLDFILGNASYLLDYEIKFDSHDVLIQIFDHLVNNFNLQQA